MFCEDYTKQNLLEAEKVRNMEGYVIFFCYFNQ